MVVVSLDFRVDVISPDGDNEVPLEVVRLESVCTPSALEDRWLLVETELFDGSGTTGVIVVCVVVELEDEFCARAAPVISVTVNVAASKVLIILHSPGELGAGRIARFSRWIMWHSRWTGGRLGNYSAAPIISINQRLPLSRRDPD